MVYLLDTNVFIEAKNRYYDFSFCPAFWDWLVLQNQAKNVFTIQEVKDELCKQTDELSQWVSGLDNSFFLQLDGQVFSKFNQVSEWAKQNYKPKAYDEFFKAADYFLVCHALAHNMTVVSLEKADRNRKNKIKIPDACDAFGINWLSTFDMLRKEQVKFIISRRLNLQETETEIPLPDNLPLDELPSLIVELEKKMKAAAKDLEFEEAAKLRDRIKELRDRL